MKIYAIALVGVVACISFPGASNAQSTVPNDYGVALNRFHAYPDEPVNTVAEENVSSRAVSRFRKSYPEALKVSWTYDQAGSAVRFMESNHEIVERYTAKGRWVSTVRTLSVVEIPKTVKQRVRVQYPRYEVNSVRYVKAWGGECYVLNLQSTDDLKTILVTEEDVQVLSPDSL